MQALSGKQCDFIAGAATIDSLPPITHPEIAFIGRSNVGKSSLVNALTGLKSLARTSQNPGLTKQLNFFLIDERLMLVDMPGYGYAKVSKQRKSEWDILILSYLCGRPNLKRACLLIDARRGFMPSDIEFMELLDETAVTYQVVLTKGDALNSRELELVLQNSMETIKTHAAAHPQVIVTSAIDKRGIDQLDQELAPFRAATGKKLL